MVSDLCAARACTNTPDPDALLLSLPGAGSTVKWADDLVYSVAGKMFAVHCLRGPQAGSWSFKVDDARFLELTGQPCFRPAPYLARARWVQVADPSIVPAAELEDLLRRSYELVFARLPRRVQCELMPAP